MDPGRLIVLEWGEDDDGSGTEVRLEFDALDADSTMVRISEGTWEESQESLDKSYGNCMGWMQMIACMKVYLEHGFNLREGFFK